MEIFLAWIIFSFIVASIGSDRKIGYWGTFFLSLLLSPIIGALFAIASERLSRDEKLPTKIFSLYKNARRAYENRDTNKAIQFLLTANEISPNSSLILFNLAVCYSDLKNEDKALFYLDKAVVNGYKNYQQIQTSIELKFLRSRPAYKEFVKNGYRLPQKDLATSDRINKLEKLVEFKEKGILTEDEFITEKKKILERNKC